MRVILGKNANILKQKQLIMVLCSVTDERYLSYRCVKCAAGFIQPYENSRKKCITAPSPVTKVLTSRPTTAARSKMEPISETGKIENYYIVGLTNVGTLLNICHNDL